MAGPSRGRSSRLSGRPIRKRRAPEASSATETSRHCRILHPLTEVASTKNRPQTFSAANTARVGSGRGVQGPGDGGQPTPRDTPVAIRICVGSDASTCGPDSPPARAFCALLVHHESPRNGGWCLQTRASCNGTLGIVVNDHWSRLLTPVGSFGITARRRRLDRSVRVERGLRLANIRVQCTGNYSRSSKSRSPEPSKTGTIARCSSSISETRRYCLMVAAPPPTRTSRPPAASKAALRAASIPPSTK